MLRIGRHPLNGFRLNSPRADLMAAAAAAFTGTLAVYWPSDNRAPAYGPDIMA